MLVLKDINKENVARISSRQVVGIDLLRFFASVFVVFFHLQFWRNGAGPTESLSQWSVVTWAGWVGVEIFFVISGFVIAYSIDGTKPSKFFINRFSRLYPSIILCSLMTSFVLLSNSSVYDVGNRLFKTFILWPYGPSVDVVYWTLSIEVIFYALAFATLVTANGKYFNFILRLVGLASASFWFARLGFDVLGIESVSAVLERLEFSRAFQATLLYHGVYFALGAALLKRETFYTSIFVVAGCVELFFRSHQFDQYSPLTPIVVWLLSVVLIIVSLKYNSWIHAKFAGWTRIIRQLGLITYPLYLIHNEVGLFIQRALAGYGMSETPAFAASFVLVLAIATIIGLFYEPVAQSFLKKVLTGFAEGIPASKSRLQN